MGGVGTGYRLLPKKGKRYSFGDWIILQVCSDKQEISAKESRDLVSPLLLYRGLAGRYPNWNCQDKVPGLFFCLQNEGKMLLGYENTMKKT
jgi:hypothetical protein